MKKLTILALSLIFAVCFAQNIQAATTTITYKYDNLDRLPEASYGDLPQITYQYDDSGNITALFSTGLSSGSVDLWLNN